MSDGHLTSFDNCAHGGVHSISLQEAASNDDDCGQKNSPLRSKHTGDPEDTLVEPVSQSLEPPPLPPRPSLKLPDCSETKSRQRSRSLRHPSLFTSRKEEACTSLQHRREVGLEQRMTARGEDDLFVRDISTERLPKTSTGLDCVDVMSGALPTGSDDTLYAHTIGGPELPTPDVLAASKRSRSRTSFSSFDSTFNANINLYSLHANSKIFSQLGVHELSRSPSPLMWYHEPASHAFVERRDSKTLDGTLAGYVDVKSPATSRNNFQSSTASTLPTELVQQIYGYLGPYDFNAARHSCHTWMSTSLHHDLLIAQLKRGGWWANAANQHVLFQEWRQAWPMSCYLARECALAGAWTGQGLCQAYKDDVRNPMFQSCSMNLANLKETASTESGSSGELICTTSLCGKYLLTASGSEIYTYEIESATLRLLSRTSCEKNVLAMSLDAGEDRLAMAVLLQDRIGLYIDLLGTSETSPPHSPWENSGTISNVALSTGPITDFETGDGTGDDVTVGDFDELSLSAGSLGSNSILHQSVEIVTQRTWSEYFSGSRARLRGIRQMPPLSSNGIWPHTLNIDKGKSRRLEFKSNPQTVYRNVCTADDPPCSVAISPTRQCVAFGCNGRVELYWVDPTTGQNLNRWFRLSRPSDHLYFLAPRRSKDSLVRLRLISTATYIHNEAGTEESKAISTSQTSFWFTVRASWNPDFTRRQEVHCADHSYALPLSDGHHILFTNENGRLCLGSDKPAGAAQRLSRKFIFEPPLEAQQNDSILVPTVYAAASDMESGVRIVAAYGDNIILFSVPVDALRYSTAEQECTLQDTHSSFDELDYMNVLKHPTSNARAVRHEAAEMDSDSRFDQLNMLWIHYLSSADGRKRESLDEIWPVKISGTVIGTLDSVKAISVQDTEVHGLVVWAFSQSGVSKAWLVDNGERPLHCIERIVGSDGIVQEAVTPP